MLPTIENMISEAIFLAGGDAIYHKGKLWVSEGGRSCPLGWDDCSQAVYIDQLSGEYDYGEIGGPGHTDCLNNCSHGMVKCPYY